MRGHKYDWYSGAHGFPLGGSHPQPASGPGAATGLAEALGGGLPPSVAVEGLEEALADGFGDRAVFVDGAGLDAHDEALEDLHNGTLVSAATTFRAHGGRAKGGKMLRTGWGKPGRRNNYCGRGGHPVDKTILSGGRREKTWSTKQLLRTGGRLLTKR